MVKLQKKSKRSEGFSLLEVAVALLILSTSVIAIYQFISSTSIASFELRDRVIAREVANNRVALMHTIDPPLDEGERNGLVRMDKKEWLWNEEVKHVSEEFSQYSINVTNQDNQKLVFIREGFIERK
ncbi:type II secretion system minor pseudopilin GspI [Gammaproteobacteria bacterium]|nr:type II secretion system minor pseudopilin GspI [Gammaproteobacteria bacterium]